MFMLSKNLVMILKKRWFMQGFNAVPLFLNTTAWSGIALQQRLGFGYSQFIHFYKHGYGEMGYLYKDFIRLSHLLNERLRRQPGYLQMLKRQYNRDIEDCNLNYSGHLTKLTNTELLRYLKQSAQMLVKACELAHFIEALSFTNEIKLRKELSQDLKGISAREQEKLFINLITPKQPSFLMQEERELMRFWRFKGKQRTQALLKHSRKYSWLQNSYTGAEFFGSDFFKKRFQELRRRSALVKKQSKNEAQNCPSAVLSSATIKLAEEIKFLTIWQDERKVNILRAVGGIAKVIKVVSQRLHVKETLLNYLTLHEITAMATLDRLSFLRKELIKREKGVFIVSDRNGEHVYIGKDYQYARSLFKRAGKSDLLRSSTELHGIIASLGIAYGPVIICKTKKAMSRVRQGDILVTSMTRPEFMPVLRKAAAIITDEGGITCHAAIVSRELGIPCIIGTKIATKVLKDGDMVEVNANHGWVRKIK